MIEQPVVTFIGAGPGDPELITIKGLKALQKADLVVYAGSLVNCELLAELKADAVAVDSAPLTLDEIVSCMAEAVTAGKNVVRLHTGDPSVYGAIQEQIASLEGLGISSRVIPGVTAAFAAAAGLGQELTLPGVSQTVIISRREGRTPVPEKENLRKIAAMGATLCLYLSVGMIKDVVADLLAGDAYSPETPVAVISKASWQDEKRVEGTLADISGKVSSAGISRQAVILVGAVLAVRRSGLPEKSKLYDRDFAHGFREKS